jgi:transcriptional regulator with XRE-family HTH domain
MLERDYDLSARGGGQRRLAEQTGLAPSAISRLLKGATLNPDPESLRLIADALALPFGTVLVHAGILTTDELTAVQASPPSDRPPLTADEAADALGLTDPVARQMHAAGVQAARDLQRQRLNGERAG